MEIISLYLIICVKLLYISNFYYFHCLKLKIERCLKEFYEFQYKDVAIYSFIITIFQTIYWVVLLNNFSSLHSLFTFQFVLFFLGQLLKSISPHASLSFLSHILKSDKTNDHVEKNCLQFLLLQTQSYSSVNCSRDSIVIYIIVINIEYNL